MKNVFKRIVVASLVFALVFSTAVFLPEDKSEVYAATTYKPSENVVKYIKEAVSAKILDKAVYNKEFYSDITKIEAVKYTISLYKFLGGTVPALPSTHPFTDTKDANVEIAVVLGLIPAEIIPPEESAEGEEGENAVSDEIVYATNQQFYPSESLNFLSAMQLLMDTIILAKPSEATYIPKTASAALTALKKKYSNASDIPSEYRKTIGYLSARGVLLLPVNTTGTKEYFYIPYYGYNREEFFLALNDAAWANAKTTMKKYLKALAKPKTPLLYTDKYSKWYNYHEALQFKNDVYVRWQNVPGAFSYKTSVYVSGKKKKDIVVPYASLSLGKSTKPTYKSIYGNNTKQLSSYVYVTPVDRHGNVGPKLKISYKVEKFVNEYQKIFGSSTRYHFTSKKQAKSYQTTIKVKVWRLKSGKKVAGTAYLTVNKALASDVKKIFAEIYKGKEKFPINGMGGFAIRSSLTTEHPAGTAIDINPNENYMIDKGKVLAGSFWSPKKSKYSIKANGDVVKAFEKYGWYWAGYGWHGGERRDYMHFSYFGT
jgi:hypothetical protein